MKSKPFLSVPLLVLTALSVLSAPLLQANDSLEIERAFIGAPDSWRDVTLYFRDQIDNGAMSVKIAQPFSEIGGDPAPGKVKNLLVDYKLNGKQYRLCLKEEFPVAFEIDIPSPDAQSPGANPDATSLMENISSFSAQHPQGLLAQALHPSGDPLLYATICISLLALVFSIVALAQVRRIRTVPPQSPPR